VLANHPLSWVLENLSLQDTRYLVLVPSFVVYIEGTLNVLYREGKFIGAKVCFYFLI
jgi:hypothetical protein